MINLVLIAGLLLATAVSCSDDDDPTIPTPEPEKGTFTDSRDGKVYEWIKIGNQTWMAKNLAYKPSGTDGYLAYDHDENNAKIYGYLYSYETAKAVVPEGWRIPTEDEFHTLVDKLGGDVPAYIKLLEKGTAHWLSPNNATNESGFTALPGGHYDTEYDEFSGLDEWTAFVSSDLSIQYVA